MSNSVAKPVEKHWNTEKMKNQKGKTVIITGGTGGVGFADAKALALKGAKVIILGRNQQKGNEAVTRIKALDSDANIAFYPVDLNSLLAISTFADKMLSQLKSLDVLINNAGIMMPAKRLLTDEGFELQFGTNYLAHFALTGKLLPLLKGAHGSRVVTLAALPTGVPKIDFDNLQAEKKYDAWIAYNQSKLANLIFALHLQRLSEQNNWGLSSFGAHPGLAVTDLITKQAGSDTGMMSLSRTMFRIFPFMRHSADKGALPTLFAATDASAQGGLHYGPGGFMETQGYPKLAKIDSQAKDVQIANRLWRVSEKLTSVVYK